MRNYLTFDNKDSRDFGVYINGQGTFRAPARSYNVLNIPGRNGDLLGFGSKLDNVEITYRAFIYTNFDANIAALRSFLLSHVGYFKLTDSYHPDEYRLAYYKGPFVPDVVANNGAGSFDLTFVCKPQRFLNSGEEVTTLTPAGAEQHTYQGEIVNFSTLAGDKITSALADFHPIQDLHGYSSPWPAGGGKNKLGLSRTIGTPNPADLLVSPRTMEASKYYVGLRCDNYYYPNYVTSYSVTDTTVKVTTTNNNRYGVAFPVACTENKSYVISATLTGAFISAGCYDSNWNFLSELFAPLGADLLPKSFVTPNNAAYITIIIGSSSLGKEGTATNIQLQEGSTATAWEPYSNICPISGRTGLSVWDDPKYGGTVWWNQHSSQFTRPSGTLSGAVSYTKAADGKTATLNGTATVHDFYQLINSGLGTSVPGHKYAVVTPHASGSATTYWFYLNSRDVHDFGDGAIWTATSSVTIVYGVEIKSGASFNNLQIDIPIITDLTEAFGAGNEPTIEDFKDLFYKDYYPYNAGETTCVSAVNGDPYWKKDIDWTSEAGTVYGGTLDVVTGVLTVDRASISSYAGETLPGAWISDRDVYAPGTSPTTGAQVVYELATPITYQLTPQEIEALADNYMWSDVGQVTVTVTDAMTIENPTLFDAKPLLRVYGAGTLTLGGQTITISTADVYTDIDCEMMDCFKDTVSKNGNVSFSGYDFPVIPPGRNVITMDGVTQVDITPRWWAA